jgi:PqqD family protein of HPr-rel-A system
MMIRIPETLSVSRLDDELVLLDERSGKYFGLNAVGSRIFSLLKETGDEAATLAALVAEYQAPEERLKADLGAFIAKLAERGLLKVDAP